MSSPDNCAEQYEISDLPPEVFPIIFKHLSVNERKAVKLVCKSWLEFFNIPSLLNDEVLTHCEVFGNPYKLSDVYEVLPKSERRFLNLKFVKVNFYDAASFWKTNGLKIRSIDFEDCQFSDGVLAEIIICCENMFHLSFTYTESFRTSWLRFLPPIIDVDEVLAREIVRENLSSLEMYFSRSDQLGLCDHILHQIFLVFPNIKILKITSDFNSSKDFYEEVHVNLSELPSTDHLTMSPVLNYLISSVNRIEKLKLFFDWAHFSENSLRLISETVSSLHRLTELGIRVKTLNSPRIEDLRTFQFPKQLKSLDFHISMDPFDLTSFLLQLLHSNSNLQYLTIYYPRQELIVTKPFYEKLISSGLKSFVVTAEPICIEDPDSFGSGLSTHCQNKCVGLPRLSVTTRLEQALDDTESFLRYYQSLHHLEAEDIFIEGLQFLLKHQTKLRSLTIWSRFLHIPSDIPQVHLTFNELTDIEHLDLSCSRAADYFLKTLSPEPILAKLKYLRVVVFELNPSNLLRSVDAMPFLEGLCISDGYHSRIINSFDVIVELCTKLNRLRYLYFMGHWLTNDGNTADEHYRKLFTIRPSLRVVVHHQWIDTTYFFDPVKQEVILKESMRKYHLDGFRVNEPAISWLQF